MLEKFSPKIKNEISVVEAEIKKILTPSISEFSDILEYVYLSKGKCIRPIVGILVSKMLGEFSSEQSRFLAAVELVHNATIFHDDVIDEAQIRRNLPTINSKFSNKIAVLSGDYFLSCAIKTIYSLNNLKINLLFSDFMKEICEGELEQNLSLGKILSVEKYLEKTRRKTAILFALTLTGVGVLAEEKSIEKELLSFGENLGMIFQLRDDLKNFENYENKPVLNDMKSGVYTAPIIFLAQENKNVLKLLEEEKFDEVILLLKKSNALQMTAELIKKYYEKAIKNAEKFPENGYKNLLLELLAELCQH